MYDDYPRRLHHQTPGWVKNGSLFHVRLRAATDPHSPPMWRVNGPLSNMPEFAQAFGCKATDKMVRKDRCEVW